MSKEQIASNGGHGIPSVLTIVFVVLRLTEHIDWPWVWVISPIWISFVLFSVLAILYLVLRELAERRALRRLARMKVDRPTDFLGQLMTRHRK